MNQKTLGATMLLLGWAALLLVADLQAATLPTVVRGGRAVALRPEPGPLTIKVTKRDLNIYEGADELTATLYDPAREPLATVTLPDDGQEGGGMAPQVQSAEMSVNCVLRGVYRLIVDAGRGDSVFGLEL